MTYDWGKLEIMTPGPEHEATNRTLEDVVVTATAEGNRDVEPSGSTTFRCPDLERGFEPDSCFYIEHAETMRGKTEIDLSVDPAPELVIEIDDTHSSLKKFDLYARIGVREVWRWYEEQIFIYELQNGESVPRERSVAFPTLTAAVLTDLIQKSQTLRRPDWMRTVRDWARQNPV